MNRLVEVTRIETDQNDFIAIIKIVMGMYKDSHCLKKYVNYNQINSISQSN